MYQLQCSRDSKVHSHLLSFPNMAWLVQWTLVNKLSDRNREASFVEGSLLEQDYFCSPMKLKNTTQIRKVIQLIMILSRKEFLQICEKRKEQKNKEKKLKDDYRKQRPKARCKQPRSKTSEPDANNHYPQATILHD